MLYSKLARAFVSMAVILVTGSAMARAQSPVSVPPQKIFDATTADLPKTPSANVRVYIGSLAPGDATFWHVHSSPPIVYIESGTGTWEYRDGRAADVRHAGQVMLEPANVAVRLVNRGTTDVHVVMTSISKPGDPFMRPVK